MYSQAFLFYNLRISHCLFVDQSGNFNVTFPAFGSQISDNLKQIFNENKTLDIFCTPAPYNFCCLDACTRFLDGF